MYRKTEILVAYIYLVYVTCFLLMLYVYFLSPSLKMVNVKVHLQLGHSLRLQIPLLCCGLVLKLNQWISAWNLLKAVSLQYSDAFPK